jgi:hypothetical protein
MMMRRGNLGKQMLADHAPGYLSAGISSSAYATLAATCTNSLPLALLGEYTCTQPSAAAGTALHTFLGSVRY